MASIEDVKKARGVVAGLLQKLMALPTELQQKVPQSTPDTFFSYSIVIASEAASVEPSAAKAALYTASLVPTVQTGGNVIFWPIGDWAMRRAAWRTLAEFVGRPSEAFSLERGSVQKVIFATKKMLDTVDTKLLVGQIPQDVPPPPPETPIYKKWWFWAIVGTVVVGGGYALTRKKKDRQPELEPATA